MAAILAAMPAVTPVRVHLAFAHLCEPRFVARITGGDPRVVVDPVPYTDTDEARMAKADGRWTASEVRAIERQPTASVRRALSDAEVLITHDAPTDVLELSPRLRWVQAIGSGVAQLHPLRFAERGIVLTNTRGVSAPAIAEFVFARALAVWKRLPELSHAQHEHRWAPIFGRRLAGRTVGIVGLGAIGVEVARLAKAFGMTVVGMRRSSTAAPTSHVDVVVPPSGRDDLLRRADLVVLCAPSTPQTRGMIDATALRVMRSDAVLCNVARGSLVDEGALVTALREGRIAAAILDVFESEPLPPDHPLWTAPNACISAHCANSQDPDEYWNAVADAVGANVRRYLAGEPLRNVVDVAALAREA